jgi:hypothetical protein
MRSALEQRLVEFVLELGDLHAERGLNDVEPLRGARDRAILEKRNEVLDLLEVHVVSPSAEIAAIIIVADRAIAVSSIHLDRFDAPDAPVSLMPLRHEPVRRH